MIKIKRCKKDLKTIKIIQGATNVTVNFIIDISDYVLKKTTF